MTNEKLIPLSAVPAILAELTGVTRSKATVYLWIKKGCRTYDGRIVMFPAKFHFGQWFTTRSEVVQFIGDVG